MTEAPGGGDRQPEPDPGDEDAPPSVGTFSLEGRAVPALYLAGWLASGAGGALLFVSLMATASAASPWVFLVGLLFLAVGLVGLAGSQAIERGRRPGLAYRGPSPVLAFGLVVAGTLLAQVVVLAPLSALGVDARAPLATLANVLLTTLLYVAVVRLLVVGTGALSWREMGAVLPVPAAIRDVGLGALLGLPVAGLTVALSSLLARPLGPLDAALPPAVDAGGALLNVISVALVAPIGQELFFRGYATTAWERTAGPRRAVFQGALFFALVAALTLTDTSFGTGAGRALHAFLVQLPLALAAGWVFLGRRSLYAAIGLHGAFSLVWVVIVPALAGGA